VLTTLERVILLQNVDVFSEVETEKLAAVAAIGVEIDALPGELLYAEAGPSDSMYVVISGVVRLHRGDIDVTRARAGEAFGTWALFDDELRVVSATCEQRARLLKIDKENFMELLADHVDITRAVLKAIVRRLRSVLGRVGSGAGVDLREDGSHADGAK
jgi:CRP-like cAMP-binding protein